MRVALMTPYTGGNLGDWAIQEAAIANVRKRHPDAGLFLVTMRPDLTAEFHGVPSIPIDRTHRWPDDLASQTGAQKEGPEGALEDTANAERPGAFGRFKAAVRSVRPLYAALKRALDKSWFIYDELSHVRHAYRFLRGVDLLVVSGGGQLDEYWGGPWYHPYALFKWGLLAKLARSRFVVLSVGTCALESKVSVFFIRSALRLASYRSYRDSISKELLESLSFTHNDAVYPDLAFSYSDCEPMDPRGPTGRRRVVGVSPIAYLARGWPKEDPAVFQPYFEALAAFVRVLLERGYSVVLFSTDSVDRAIVDDMVDALDSEAGFDSSRLSHPRTDTLPQLFEQLGHVDCVVASRLHGVILSHRCGLPVLAISYDRKVDTHMEDLGLTKHCVDIHDLRLDSLVHAFEALIEDFESIRSTLVGVNDRYGRELQHQYDAVLGRVENGEAS